MARKVQALPGWKQHSLPGAALPCAPLTSLLRSSRTSTNLAGNQPVEEAGSCEEPGIPTLPPMGLRTVPGKGSGTGGMQQRVTSLTAQPSSPIWSPD